MSLTLLQAKTLELLADNNYWSIKQICESAGSSQGRTYDALQFLWVLGYVSPKNSPKPGVRQFYRITKLGLIVKDEECALLKAKKEKRQEPKPEKQAKEKKKASVRTRAERMNSRAGLEELHREGFDARKQQVLTSRRMAA